MNERHAGSPAATRDLGALAAFVVVCLAVSAVGGAVTASSVGGWYAGLEKPGFNPPDWVFAPVWTVLYLMMAVAGWQVWRRAGFRDGRIALALFAIQLALNLAWSFLFFGLRRIDLALVEIVVLLAVILLTTIHFWRIDRIAGLLFVPYAAWVAYALVLNVSLLVLN